MKNYVGFFSDYEENNTKHQYWFIKTLLNLMDAKVAYVLHKLVLLNKTIFVMHYYEFTWVNWVTFCYLFVSVVGRKPLNTFNVLYRTTHPISTKFRIKHILVKESLKRGAEIIKIYAIFKKKSSFLLQDIKKSNCWHSCIKLFMVPRSRVLALRWAQRGNIVKMH